MALVILMRGIWNHLMHWETIIARSCLPSFSLKDAAKTELGAGRWPYPIFLFPTNSSLINTSSFQSLKSARCGSKPQTQYPLSSCVNLADHSASSSFGYKRGSEWLCRCHSWRHHSDQLTHREVAGNVCWPCLGWSCFLPAHPLLLVRGS